MNLFERTQLARQQVAAPGAETPAGPVTGATGRLTETGPGADRPERTQLSARLPSAGAAPADSVGRLKEESVRQLFDRLGSRLTDPNLDAGSLRAMVVTELNLIVGEGSALLSGPERQQLIREVERDVLGFGPLEPLLADPAVTEIMVNGPDQVYVEQAGRILPTTVRFLDEPHLLQIIDRIVSRVGRRIDESSPLVDARLEDGSRVNAIIAPLAVSGPALTIRKFSAEALTVPDLIRLGTLTPEMAELLQACVTARLNVLVSGGTGTGKTTLLNVLSSFIGEAERIVTIEDAVELKLQQEHLVRLESRPANIEGRGEITIRDLVRNALRMRPDRIIVGEVRGAEALDMLQAMNTGHDGSLSTVHANSPRDALSRLETLVLMAGMDLPLRAVREQVSAAIDVIVHLGRLRDGTRRVVGLTEVNGMEGQTITTQEIFAFDFGAGVDAAGRFLGRPVATGVRPVFADRFADLGIHLPARVFGAEPGWAGRR